MHRFVRTTVVAAALAVTGAPLSAQLLYRNPSNQGAILLPGVGGYGQAVTISTTTRVTSFGFSLFANGGSSTSTFQAYIATRDNPSVRLWESGSFSRTVAAGAIPSDLVVYRTNDFSIDLAPGTYYFVMATIGGPRQLAWGLVSGGAYTQNGISQVAARNIGDIAVPIPPGTAGDILNPQADLVIEGTQNLTPPAPGVVPEPSTYALMATGLAGLAALRRRRAAGMA